MPNIGIQAAPSKLQSLDALLRDLDDGFDVG
jgi:hypothetical protein